MSTAERVKKWRKETKKRLVEGYGGKCCICGYNRSHDAIDFHHVDPSKKDFSIGRVRANPKSIKRIVEELKKCIPVCANCHREIHSGITQVPEELPVLNEKEILDYRKLPMTPCLNCGKEKSMANKYCSYSCSGKASRKVNWKEKDQWIIENYGKISLVKMGDELGVTDNAVRKRLKKLKIIPA